MDIAALADAVRTGDRRALARAITLVESGRADHRADAIRLLEAVGSDRQALRVGVTGAPGVGKSTFIEALGCRLAGDGVSIAVLAVDPSSERTGGSILGDKTRMAELARAPHAFVRPSPSGSEPGGVARRTREAIALCEAAGFDLVLVETVGVGQSDIIVATMTDVFVLLVAPGGGDELQGVKRGIMEHADLILVTKADGGLRDAATRTAADYSGALTLLRRRPGDPEGIPKAILVSARDSAGLGEMWQALTELSEWRRRAGHGARRRAQQARHWFAEEVRHGVAARVAALPELRAAFDRIEAAVLSGGISASAGADQFLALVDRRVGGAGICGGFGGSGG